MVCGSASDVEKELNKLEGKYYMLVLNPIIENGNVCVLVQVNGEK